MCSRVRCRNCGKATWSGCGFHIESALRGVAEADRCPGWKNGKCTAPPNPNAQNDDTGCKIA